ncbi:hypothetical protein ZWY2020_047706 [Hordeum vulgare]|nr:hypothetical protein ZWY2020_047706 [Hordeum vulgare]
MRALSLSPSPDPRRPAHPLLHLQVLVDLAVGATSRTNRSVLVTGGAGFIGTHTVLQLLEKGNAVTAVDNFRNSVPEALDRVCHIVGPVPDPPALTFGWIEEDALVLVLLLHRFSFSPVSGMVFFFSAIGVVGAVAIAAAVVVGEVQSLPDLPGACPVDAEATDDGSGGKDDDTVKQHFARMPHMFSVLRRGAEDCFPHLGGPFHPSALQRRHAPYF